MLFRSNAEQVQLVNENNGQRTNLFVYVLLSSVEYWPSGYVKSMKIVFRDNFAANGLNTYHLYLNTSPVSFGSSPLMQVVATDPSSHSYSITNGQSSYRVTNDIDTTNTLPGKYSFLTLRKDNAWTYHLLSPIAGVVLHSNDNPNNSSFSLGIGLPVSDRITVSPSMVAISFSYEKPVSAGYGVNAASILKAKATIFMFAGDSHVYTDANYFIKQNIFVHNGFSQGAFLSNYSNVTLGTTIDLPATLNGMNVSGADTPALALVGFSDKMRNGNLFPAIFAGGNNISKVAFAGTRVPNKYNDYYVVQQSTGGVLVYNPDFQRLASGPLFGTYTAGAKQNGIEKFFFGKKSLDIPKFTMVLATKGSSRLISPVMTTGWGLGWVPGYIPAGPYESTVIMSSVNNFGTIAQYGSNYNNVVNLIKAVTVASSELGSDYTKAGSLVSERVNWSLLSNSSVPYLNSAQAGAVDALTAIYLPNHNVNISAITGNALDDIDVLNNSAYTSGHYNVSLTKAFAGALWDLSQNHNVGPQVTEKLLSESIKFWNPNVGLSTVMNLADQQWYNGAHLFYITGAFERHNFYYQHASVDGNSVSVSNTTWQLASHIVGYSLPDIMTPGQKVDAYVKIQNVIPNVIWGPVPFNSKNPNIWTTSPSNITITPNPVYYPTVVTLKFKLTAPNKEGVYPCDWQLYDPGHKTWFGEILSHMITVQKEK